MSASASVTLPYPVSANRYWRSYGRGGRAIVTLSAEAAEYKARAAIAWGAEKPIAGRIALHVRLYPARPQDWAKRAAQSPGAWDDSVRCLDLDNALKVAIDALNGIAYVDDSQIKRLTAAVGEPVQGGGLSIKVREILLRPMQPCVRADCGQDCGHVIVEGNIWNG
jgi:crossover junction endodeoxyribonuclease RusA